MLKLHAKNCGLQRVEPEIPANQIVMVFHRSAVLPECAELPSQGTVRCGDEPGVSERTEILRWKKREAADGTDTAGGPAPIACSDRLRRVFNHRHLGPLRNLENRSHVGALPEQMDGHDGFRPRR